MLTGLSKPDMGLTAWADTQIGDLLARVVAATNAKEELRERSGMAPFEGKPFSLAVYFASSGYDGHVGVRLAFKAKMDEKGSLVRNPYYYQLIDEMGYAPGLLVMIEATTSLVERPMTEKVNHQHAPPAYLKPPPHYAMGQPSEGALFPTPMQ